MNFKSTQTFLNLNRSLFNRCDTISSRSAKAKVKIFKNNFLISFYSIQSEQAFVDRTTIKNEINDDMGSLTLKNINFLPY
jgi:hypothetical protein